MAVSTLSEDDFLALLRRLQGSGYTTDPDSAREVELSAVARIAARATEPLAAFGRNLFLKTASEALDALERVRFFVGSEGLAPERRQRRLVAFAQGAAKMVEERLSNAIATYLGSATGQTVHATGAHALAHRASPAAALVVGRLEPSADKHAARDLAPILARGLPARALTGEIGTVELVYGAALDTPRSIGVAPSVAVAAQTKARVAPVEVFPGQVVTPASWIELQSMLIPKSHGCSLDLTKLGRTVMCQVLIGAGASLAVDGPTVNSAPSWANRLLSVSGVVTPEDEDDLTVLPASDHVWLGAAKLGPAGTGPTQRLVTAEGVDAVLTARADASGNLLLTNTDAAGRYVTLVLRSSPVYVPGAGSDTQPWLSTATIARDPLGELYRSTVISGAAPGQFSGAPAGALRRIVYTGGLTRELGAGRTQHVVLDSSEDYRNRYLLVIPLTRGVDAEVDSPAYYPAANADGLASRATVANAPRLFYTGVGAAAGSDAPLAHQHPDALAAPDVWLFADEDGNLCAEMKEASAHVCACLLALVVATEQTTGSSVVTAVPLHATRVQTLDLEQPQNTGVFAQGHQGGVPRANLSAPSPRAIPTAPPLGLLSEGPPPVRPVAFTVRERLGALNDGTYEVRQKLLGQRRRVISLVVPADSTTPVDDFNKSTELSPGVNDQIDFRDRFVWVEGRFGTSDVRISASSQVADNAAAVPFFAAFYTGPFGDVEVALSPSLSVYFEFSRQGEQRGYHSRLCLRNTGDDPVFVNATLECSGFLGMTDLRQYGVINAFTYSSTDEPNDDESRGYADDHGTSGGPYRGTE